MRAKFFISGDAQTKAMASLMTDLLSEIALVFEHSFIMKQVDSPVTDPAEAGNVYLALVQEKPISEVAAQCKALAVVRNYHPEDALCDISRLKHDKLPQGLVIAPVDQQEHALSALMKIAALENIPASARILNVFDGETPLADFMKLLIEQPDTMGVVYCPLSLWDAINTAISLLSGMEDLCFDRLLTEKQTLYSIPMRRVSGQVESESPYGMLFALAEVLNKELHLETEAGCLKTAIVNTLTAGWRTRVSPSPNLQLTDAEHICDLIKEQLSMMGEFIKPR